MTNRPNLHELYELPDLLGEVYIETGNKHLDNLFQGFTHNVNIETGNAYLSVDFAETNNLHVDNNIVALTFPFVLTITYCDASGKDLKIDKYEVSKVRNYMTNFDNGISLVTKTVEFEVKLLTTTL